MPGLITARVRDGAIEASSDLPVPWWSFTKTALAAAALVLVARRRLHLDDPVAGQDYTLRQLLQHRSGLPDYGALTAYHQAVAAGEAPWAAADMLARAGADDPPRKPGQAFGYSNIGYLFVCRLIAQAFGGTPAAAVAELVLAPLGIAGVTFAASPRDLDHTAWGNAAGYDPGWVYHGLLVGPARAAVLLLHRLLTGGLLPPALLRAMCTPQPVFASMPGRPWISVGYGLGLGMGHAQGGLFTGHTGAGPGSVSAVYHLASAGSTAAAFAPLEQPGAVELAAVRLLSA